MNVTKKTVFTMSMPYAVSTVHLAGRNQVIAATEDYGKMILTEPPDWTAQELLPGPGGCMSIAQPSNSDDIYTIFGCFPGYKFHGAGVYRIHAAADRVSKERAPVQEWGADQGAPLHIQGTEFEAHRIFPLPFAHRICFVNKGGIEYLIAANLAETKSTPDDWTHAGTVFAAPISAGIKSGWKPTPIFESLHKNHCMFSGNLHGRRVFLVGGVEGLFRFDLDAPGSDWKIRRVLDQEVSEVVVIDLDGDGEDELVTIEPFHGNHLYVYRAEGQEWKREAELKLDFGHGAWGGTVAGKAAIVVGNRAGSKNLDIVRAQRGPKLLLERRTIAEGVGSANVAVVDHEGTSWIVATNQAESAVTAYRVDEL